jgi:nickel-dependent lactate racemase
LLIAGLWEELSQVQLDPGNLLILQPFEPGGTKQFDPRVDLPEDIREKVGWKIHNPDEETACGYLASTASGERIYLAREVLDADVVVTVGQTSFDRRLGYRGTSSSLYPGLSNAEAVKRCQGQGHRELSPADARPLRELNDEAAWLLGTQFTVQVIASKGGSFSQIAAGEREKVLRHCKSLLDEMWLAQIDERPETVIVAVEIDAGGHGWKQVGSALSTARSLVRREGKIVVLTDLREQPGAGMTLLKDCREPREVYAPLGKLGPADQSETLELLDALDQASIYFLSQLPSDQIEELHLIPLDSSEEVGRLLSSIESCVAIESAQHSWGQVIGE